MSLSDSFFLYKETDHLYDADRPEEDVGATKPDVLQHFEG